MDPWAWWAQVGQAGLMVLVLFVPGWIGARALGVRGTSAPAVAPLLPVGAAGIGAVVAGAVGLRWGAGAFLVSVLVLLCGCVLAGRALEVGLRDGIVGLRPGRRGLLTTGTVLVAWVLTSLPTLFRSSPDLPIQQYDAVFHMNAVWWILREGNGSSFGGLTRLFGMDTTSTTVPAGWHDLVAVFASPSSVVTTVNTFVLVVPLLWFAGVAGLAEELLPGRPGVAALAVASSTLVVEFPDYMLSKYPAWPNALAMALLPALVVVSVQAARLVGRAGPGRRLRTGLSCAVVWTVAVVGACLVHPLAGLSLLVLGLIPSVTLALGRWRRLVGRGRARRVVAEVGVVLGALAGVWAVLELVPALSSKLALMSGAYTTQPNTDWYNPLKALVLWPIVDPEAPWGLDAAAMLFAVVAGTLVVSGLVMSLRSRAGRLLVGAWAGAYLLTLTTLMRSGPLLGVAGLWYMSSHRAMAVQAGVQALVMAQGLRGLTEAGRWMVREDALTGVRQVVGATRLRGGSSSPARRTSAVWVVVVLVLGGGGLAPLRSDMVWRVHSLDSPFVSVLLTSDTLALVERVHEVLPEDAVVLGDPWSGAAYLQAVGDRQVVFPQLQFRDSDTDEEYLRVHFHDIASDPEVCRILEDRGIDYAWVDSQTWHAGEDRALESPGLYGVDLSTGFEVLDSAGSVTLVKITACG